MKLEFSKQIFEKKIFKYKVRQKSVQWDPELFHTDRQTDTHSDVMKLIVAFRNLTNASKTYVKADPVPARHFHGAVSVVLASGPANLPSATCWYNCATNGFQLRRSPTVNVLQFQIYSDDI